MRRLLAQFPACSRATSAVEFGLISLPLRLFVMGTMEFGRLMWTREALQSAAITGARCMGLVQTECGTAGTYSSTLTTSYIQAQAAKWSLSLNASDIVLSPVSTCSGVSGFSQVSITYTFSTIVPRLITSLSGGTVVGANACFPNHV